MKSQSIELKADWIWKERDTNVDNVWLEAGSQGGWHPVLEGMPSDIHIELLKVQKIPDPFVGFNEHKVQWVGEREWLYSTSFLFDNNAATEHVELVFEGLDTYCSAYLNAKLILEADNQFRTYRIKLEAEDLKTENLLLLHFKSAKYVAIELEKKYGRVRAGSCNLGDPSRVYVRKAQYDWRWDWGPELMTAGPYRPIRLLTYTAHIVDLHPRATLSDDLSPSLVVEISARGNTPAIQTIQLVLRDSGGNVVRQDENIKVDMRADTDTQIIEWNFNKGEVKLWWPTGYGEQVLYEVEVILLGQNSLILDQQKKAFGFRRVRLIQEPLVEADQHGKGTTFLFEVNNVRIFIGGSNWVPADAFFTKVTAGRFRAWLQLMKDGNQNMVRIWGGGVYEPDVFYDICDELGLLVWQDFQFACGVYPAHDEFVESVKLEAEENVRRLRHHPCMTLFCGNNEDYQQILQWGGITDLPARKIYEQVLPSVVTALTKDEIPYHRGSPYGGEGWDTADPTVGDIHQWKVWAGPRIYHDYDILGGRFVSEFGIPAMPDMRTIDFWMQSADEKERYAQSKTMAQHNRAGNHERRFAVCMNDNFRLTGDLETHAYNTQVMQYDALGFAYRSWRREWRGPGKQFTAGAIVWQINDSWPVTSWAIADYFMRPKPAYFSIARELRPYTVGVFRSIQKSRDCDRPRQFYDFGAFPCVSAQVEVWGTNATLEKCAVILELLFIDLESAWSHRETRNVLLEPNQTTEILKMPIPEPPEAPNRPFVDLEPKRTLTHSIVVAARLFDASTKEVLSRIADWPQPYRFIDFPSPSLKVEVDGEIIKVEVEKPVKGLVFSVDGEENVKWSDNALDVIPGDPQEITAIGVNGRKLKVAYMGSERAKEIG